MIIGSRKKEPTKADLLWDEKVVDSFEIGSSIRSMKARNPQAKIGLYCGDFQDLTPADCVFLQLCRSSCDLLVAIVPTDYSLRTQGKIPRFSTAERTFRLGSIVSIQFICLFDEESPSLCIDSIDPDFIFYGRTRNDEDQYSSIIQKDKLTLVNYPWRDERIEGRFFHV